MINGYINNWIRVLDNDLMCDIRLIVKDIFVYVNIFMILGSCEFFGFFYFFCYSFDIKMIYI